MPLTTFLKKLSPGRIIALGFLFCILLGSLLLILPCSLQPGIALPYLDALYTATSAVCVTGLNVIDPGSTFSPFGQLVLGCLIQIGGLGVASIGVGIMLAMGKKINLVESSPASQAEWSGFRQRPDPICQSNLLYDTSH